MIRLIMGFIKFIYNDFKTDFITLTHIIQGKYKCKYTLKEMLDFRNVLQQNWLFFLIIVLAFCVGFFFASQYYQQQCNEFIVENYLNYSKYGGIYIEQNLVEEPHPLEELGKR